MAFIVLADCYTKWRDSITDGLRTMLDLAATLDALTWEQALESALRKDLFALSDLQAALGQRRKGNPLIRSVLDLRPDGAPPTESLLETLAVQLMRTDKRLPLPTRQLEVRWPDGRFEARVDLAFPEHGVFIELDGQQHKGQPVYDASRQTAVVALTGWMVGRFTWTEIVHHPKATVRRMVQLLHTASQRSSAA